MKPKNIVAVGGGATSVYLLYHLVRDAVPGTTVHVVDTAERPGLGMPYSTTWVGDEHLANIACDEIPDLLQAPDAWLSAKSDAWLAQNSVKRSDISPGYILPRVILGMYLEDQFRALCNLGRKKGMHIDFFGNNKVTDIATLSDGKIRVSMQPPSGSGAIDLIADKIVVAAGHVWPKQKEGTVAQYYDSPWPVSKISGVHNYPVGLLGSNLTAVDATMTLAKNHGTFKRNAGGRLEYVSDQGAENFKIVMHSRQGLLPSMRFQFEYPRIRVDLHISIDEVENHIRGNDGYLSLDFIFEKAFKNVLREKNEGLYPIIKDMSVEEFVAYIYKERRGHDRFALFQKEYEEARESLRTGEPIYWKEMLDDIAYTINFYAKYLSAEDMLRLRRTLMPLVLHIVCFLPLESAERMMALHDAGKFEIKSVGSDSSISTNPRTPGASIRYQDEATGQEVNLSYQTFINCMGQKGMPASSFPFPSLTEQGVVNPAQLKFLSNSAARKEIESTRPGEPSSVHQKGNSFYLDAGSIAVDDFFRPIDALGQPNDNIHIVAPPYIAGTHPYYAGLPFCNEALEAVADCIYGKQPKMGLLHDDGQRITSTGLAESRQRQAPVSAASAHL